MQLATPGFFANTHALLLILVINIADKYCQVPISFKFIYIYIYIKTFILMIPSLSSPLNLVPYLTSFFYLRSILCENLDIF